MTTGLVVEIASKLYGIGNAVPQSGMYVCVPCGYMQYFSAGENFTTCTACFAGTADGPVGYQEEESEFWSFVG